MGDNARETYTPTVTGTYYVQAGEVDGETGTYTVSVIVLGANGNSEADTDFPSTSATTGRVEVGASATGNIESGTDRDWFRLDLEAGKTYQIDLEGDTGGGGTLGDPYLRNIRDSSGTEISGTENDDIVGGVADSRVVFTPTADGAYYLVASGFDGTYTGTYTLSVTELETRTEEGDTDFANDVTTLGRVEVGGSATGEIENVADSDWFRVVLEKDKTYVFDLEGTETSSGTLADPLLLLRDASGSTLEGDDDGGDGANSRLEYTATADGIHYLTATTPTSATSGGTYTLSVSEVLPCTLNEGDIWCGVVDVGEVRSTADVLTGHGFVGITGRETGGLAGHPDDTMFSVGDNDYTIQGIYVGAGTNNEGALFLLLTADLSDDDEGILVLAFDGVTTLRPLDDATKLSTGLYQWSTDLDWSSTTEVTVRLQTPSDCAAGTTTTCEVAVGGSVTGNIGTATDADWFKVVLEAGKTYQIDLEGMDTGRGTLPDPWLALIADADGNVIPSTGNADGGVGKNARTILTPTTAGAYYVVARTNLLASTVTGTYTLSVIVLGANGASEADTDCRNDDQTTCEVDVGGSVTGNIGSGDQDWFKVVLEADKTYQIDMEGSDTSGGTLTNPELLNIRDSETDAIADTGNDDIDNDNDEYNSQVVFTPTEAGDYYLVATSANSGTGTYTLSVSEITPADDDDSEGSTVLVSNIEEFHDSESNLYDEQMLAQAFSIAADSGDYTLTSIEIPIVDNGIAAADIESLSVSVWSTDSSGEPSASLHTLTNPGSITADTTATFNAQPGMTLTLEAGNTYAVLVRYDKALSTNFPSWASTEEYDQSGAVGWEIADESLTSETDNVNWVSSDLDIYRMRINGSAASGGTPAACTLNEGDIWCGVVTVGDIANDRHGFLGMTGGLSDETFSLMFETGTTNNYTILAIQVASEQLYFVTDSGLTDTEVESLALHVDGESDPFVWSDSTAVIPRSYRWPARTGLDWSSETTVTLRLREFPRPRVTNVAVTSTPVLETDTYGAGETIEVSVTFSEAVDATSDTDFELNVSDDKSAPLVDGSGTETLVFGYTVAPDEEDDNGIWIGDQDRTLVGSRVVSAQSGTITSVATSATADLTHDALRTQPDHKVDGTRSIVSVEVTSEPLLETDTYGAGETIQFTVTFTAAVDVTGDPVLEFLFDGSELRQAGDVSGSGTTELVFGYTVVSGDDDDNGLFLRDESDYNNPDGPVRLDSNDEIEFKDTSTDVPLYWQGRGTQSGHKVDGSRTTDNTAPSFTSSPTFDVAENQTVVGTVLAADSDADDSVTGYAITGGADQTFFSIGATSGALTFDAAPNYEDADDSGTNNTYVVDVTATSGAGTRVMTATQTITVTVTDVDTEAPGKPGAPTVSAASATSLSVSWSAPSNAGPAITDYDVQYRAGTSGDWSDGGHVGTATTATLTGLSEDTSYQVQVRATNAEGTGDWSDSGSGTTDAAASDDCTDDTTTTCEVDVGGSVTGTLETAGDSDWFKVVLEAGTRYQIDLEGADTGRGTLPNPGAILYDRSSANVAFDVNGGVGDNARVIYTPTAAGAHYVQANTASGTGIYTLSVIVLGANGNSEADTDFPNNNTTNGKVEVGASATGNVESAADRDWFAVDLEAGKRYQFDLEGAPNGRGTQPDPFLLLYDRSATAIEGNDDLTPTNLNSAIVYDVTATGTYYLVARGARVDQTGTYTLSVRDITPAVLPTLSIADAAGDEDDGVEFTATLTAGVSGKVTATWTASIESDDTAVAADLATTKTGEVEFEENARSAKFTVPVNDDTIDENNETFTVTLSGVSSNAQLAADPTAKGTILDDDAAGEGVAVLLSNLGQDTDEFASASVGAFDAAQGFTTGSARSGYFLDSIKLDVQAVPNTPADVTVQLWSASNGNPDASIATLTHSTGSWDTGVNTFSASPAQVLAAETKYFVVLLYSGQRSYLDVNITKTDSADDASTEWEVTGRRLERGSDNQWRRTSGQYLKFSVGGRVTAEGGTDLPANATTSGVVEVGGAAVRGDIFAPEFSEGDGPNEVDGWDFDTDWFEVELEADKTYRIDMWGHTTANGLTLRLPQINAIYDSKGSFIVNTWYSDESDSHYLFRVTFTASSNRSYYIAASGESFEWGTYKLWVKDITEDDHGDHGDEGDEGDGTNGGKGLKNLRAIEEKGGVRLTWQSPDGAAVTGYRIERRRAGGQGSGPQRSHGQPRDHHTLVEDTGNTETSYVDESAEQGVEYEYQVSAHNESGPGEESDWVRAGPEEEPVLGDALPGAPRNLTATPGNREVTLSWDPPDDNGNPPATRYRIEWRVDGKDYDRNDWGTSQETTYTTNAQANLANGVKYFFRVKAENDDGNSYGPYGPSSGEVSATPTSGSAVDLGTPVLSDTETLHHGIVKLDWQDIEDAGWYVVQYYHVEDEEWLDLPAEGVDIAFHGSSAVVSNLHGLSWLRVGAASCDGASEWSQIEELYGTNASDWEGVPVPDVEEGDEIEPCPVVLGTPVLSDTEILHHGMVQLDWQDIEDAGWYVVQYYHLEGEEWLDLPAEGVDIAFHGSSAVVSNLHGLSWLRVGAASCDGASEWSQIEESYGTNASDWKGVPVPEVAEGDEIEPCSEDADTPDNSPATGAPTIGGTAQVGQTLTSNTSGVIDADGLSNVQYEYQWLADDSEISGATNATYTLVAADEGKAVKVQVSFTDDADNEETLTSAATEAVSAAPTPNSPATGAPTISGTAQVGETLTANTSGVTDADGLSNVQYEYQWLADDSDIAGASGSTYTLTDSEGGKVIKVEVSFTDDADNEETLTSAATDVVAGAQPTEPPDKPTGLEATASHDSVTLTWDDPGDDSITGYVILRRIPGVDSEGHFDVLVADTGTAATTYTDNTVAAETRYTYRIKAINGAGTSERSRWSHIDTPAAPVPDKPTGLEATVTHGQVVLTWDDPGDDSITGYVILRRVRENNTGGDFSVLVADTGSAATTYTDDTVAAGTTYTYRIKAINEHGTSERSRWYHIDIPAAP